MHGGLLITAMRIDDAPVVRLHIRAFVTARDEEAFFFSTGPS